MLNRLDVGRWGLDLKNIPPEHVIELGSLNINGSVRSAFSCLNVRYTGVDLVAGPGVDVVDDGACYTPTEQPSMVVCCEVLEHADAASGIVQNAGRMLAVGGWLLLTCATHPRAPHSAVDGGPLRSGEFYANVAPTDLRAWVKSAGLDISHEEVHFDRGDLYMLAQRQS